jgi:hypothetical protein
MRTEKKVLKMRLSRANHFLDHGQDGEVIFVGEILFETFYIVSRS